jgi:hypothetical protein
VCRRASKKNSLKEALSESLAYYRRKWEDMVTLDSAKKMGEEKYKATILLLQSNLDIL